MKDWIPAAVMMPTIDENGEKVLLYRTMNDQQQSMAVSIHDTAKVKYCQLDETWWMQLPAPPSDGKVVEKVNGTKIGVGDVIRILDADGKTIDLPIYQENNECVAIVNNGLGLKTWFYRDTLATFSGNAKIIGVVKELKNG